MKRLAGCRTRRRELTGMDAFEEVVNVDDIPRLQDPLKERLLEIAKKHVPEAL